jgi:hypothetical protein
MNGIKGVVEEGKVSLIALATAVGERLRLLGLGVKESDSERVML